MKKLIICLFVFSALSCGDLTDFTTVVNPNLSQESVLGQPNSSVIWLTGMERQLSIVINEVVINAEIASDNYNNDQTFYNQFLDNLDINKVDDDVADIQFAIQRLRAMSVFGIDEVGPNDPNYNAETEAEYKFMRGLASMYSGMYFVALSDVPGSAPKTADENLAEAVINFTDAIAVNPKPEYYLGQARAHYLRGHKDSAMASAQAALDASGDFIRVATYDESENPDNVMEDALYERGTFDDLQPLPTLDFLDPKYSFLSPTQDDPVNYLKAEEAHLILIEGLISNGDVDGAKAKMEELAVLVASRPARSIDDSIEGRTHFAPGTRPDSACVVVNGREGLVLSRDIGDVTIPNVSGTSLTQADIDGIAGETDALYLLYRTRQEIFIAEGMRMVDMGVKLVLSEEEELLNDNVSDGGLGTVPQIPPFIDSVKDQLDLIQYTPGECTASTVIDVSQILVDNRMSPMVLPFH